MISCVDLFCGLGGLTHGLIRGGVNVVAGFDVDPACEYPYRANNQARFIAGNVMELKTEEVRSLWTEGAYSLLAGCAPCQPFSTYSQKVRGTVAVPSRDGGEKWRLLESFGRLVKETQPHLVSMENVPQLQTHSVFTEFLANLEEYRVWYRVVECSEYGVPQTRRRLVLLASRLGPIELQPPSPAAATTVRQTIAHFPALSAGASNPDDTLHSACHLSPLNLKRIRASRPGGTWRDWPCDLVAPCHRKTTGATYPSVYGRMAWDEPAPTITTQCFGYGNGRFGHPEQDRAISLREAAVLQTFPEDYQFLENGERVRFNVLGRLIGNAVPVKLGEAIAQSLRRHIESVEASGWPLEPVRRPSRKPMPRPLSHGLGLGRRLTPPASVP